MYIWVHLCTCMYMYVAVTAESVATYMGLCENSFSGPFGGTCYCPADIMSYHGLTEAELTFCMEQQQPTTWTDAGQYCGDAAYNCTEPACITLPR